MSHTVPHTATLYDSMHRFRRATDPITQNNVTEIQHPVGFVHPLTGQLDPRHPIYEAGELIQWITDRDHRTYPHNREQVDVNNLFDQIDAVRWTDLRRQPFINGRAVRLPPNYDRETRRLLEEARNQMLIRRTTPRRGGPGRGVSPIVSDDIQHDNTQQQDAPGGADSSSEEEGIVSDDLRHDNTPLRFRSTISGMTHDRPFPTQPTWLLEYWRNHPYSDAADGRQGIRRPSVQDQEVRRGRRTRVQTQRWNEFRMQMAENLQSREFATGVFQYWITHPIRATDSEETKDAYFSFMARRLDFQPPAYRRLFEEQYREIYGRDYR